MWKVNDCHGTVFQCSCFSRNPSSWSPPPPRSLSRSLARSLSLLSLFIHRLVLHSSAQAERNKTVYAAAKADKFAQGINIYKPRLSPYRNTTWRTWACTYGTIQHDPDSTAAISASALTIEKVLGSLGEGWHFHFFFLFCYRVSSKRCWKYSPDGDHGLDYLFSVHSLNARGRDRETCACCLFPGLIRHFGNHWKGEKGWNILYQRRYLIWTLTSMCFGEWR